MKELLKNLGIILILIGVGFLAIPFFQGTLENWHLVTGLVIMIVGFFSYVIVNKKTY